MAWQKRSLSKTVLKRQFNLFLCTNRSISETTCCVSLTIQSSLKNGISNFLADP